MGLVWHGGELKPEEGIALRHDERSFLYGDGLFETLRTVGGRLLQPLEHARRMLYSAEALGFSGYPDEERLVRIMEETASANMAGHGGELYLRATLSRGAGYGPDITRDHTALLLVYAKPLPEPDPGRYEKGITAVFASERRAAGGTLFQHKSTSYLPCLMARREAAVAGAGEALILDTDGTVLEGGCSNLFIVNGGTLRTAPAAANLLPGITRATVMELAGREGLEAKEESFTADEVCTAGEVFLTNSIQGILPLVEVAGAIIGSGKPGSLTCKLMERYNRFIGMK